MTSRYTQGTYYPANRNKYIGIKDPQYRSSWEYSAFVKLDNNASVLRWGSEIIALPYVFELDGRKHKYYIDLYVEMFDAKNNKLDKWLIEIKPEQKIFMPTKPKINNAKAYRNYNLRMVEWRKNINKWQFASNYSVANGFVFLIMTENGSYIVNNGVLNKVSEKRFF
jgi:hypothetical protein